MEECIVNSKKLLLLIIVIASIFTSGIFPFNVNALGSDSRTIRVAYPIQKGLTELDKQGKYSGYTYEYLLEIAQYTGWNYEFVQVSGDENEILTKLMKMLEKGEIDIMGGMLYNEQMEKLYNYAGNSYGVVNTVLQVLYENTAIDSISLESMKEIRIAVIENSNTRLKELNEYCKMNLISPKLVYCKSQEEQLQALKNGKADALLNVSMSPIEGVRTIAKFSPKPFYFITPKGNTDLTQRLNSAINNIEQTDPYFSTTLYEKYFTPENNKMLLSDDETTYIKDIDTLKVGVLLNKPPFQNIDEKTGELKGISIDLLNHISDKTGLKFELVPAKSQKDLDKMTENHEIDIVAGMIYDYENSRKHNVTMSRSFVSTQYIMMINNKLNENSLDGKRLALPKGIIYDNYFKGDVVWYDTLEECIEAVNKGDVDYTYGEGYSIQYYMNQPKYKNVRLVPQTYEPQSICFGIVKPSKQELLGIFNKAIISIPSEKMQSIIYQNTTYRQDFSLLYIMQQNPIETVLIVASLLLCIIGGMAWSLHTRKSMNQKISLELKKHSEVYEMASEYFFEYDYRQDKLIVSMKGKGISTYYGISKSDNSTMSEIEIEYNKKFSDVIKSQENGTTEMYSLCSDGNCHWIRITSKIIYNEKNVPVYVIGKISNIDSEKEEKDRLLDKAQKDGLTNIFNAAYIRKLTAESLSTLSPNKNGALLILDIDYFKSINDNYGHLVGDEVLIDVAKMLERSFEKDDIVGRLGGDEFSIYIRDIINKEELVAKCNYVYEQIHLIKLPNGKSVSISMGVAITKYGQKYDELYKMADDALYDSKKQGRNKFKIVEV
ncbi:MULTISPECIES: diguanylate cyclase domain-containing protein [unclassified Clostridioides]|uniref:transporter substrate-binding domain-containing diguanylate cyclase n=1 Tax=unclassified Clostridioides TaxID=2635829 RepID=UPI001DE10756|nr:transporter substrate-binding domain-containing protein [Clostridioides sp. ZZV14-6150]MCC0668715.1 transporter substrate-binding domain-containing protein [Clostridioides sp. ZZV14-6153]MCC0721945.1 transporter substrate-binding domain-containing protein [Clostridioides sp. ZZV14-6104]MCC0731795.1 transporter substrate-binding domain-containing protein [Clostridioides sp. ZZV14-6048]MCC0743823.1 transporter substrate-binding domain-containing protein [Clostridioides sp. ZZV14-6044]